MSSRSVMLATLLFGFALFLASALLFALQPILARTLLPHLRDNPLAWNACLVFFLGAFLAGCVLVNLLHRFGGLRWQPWLQIFLMTSAVVLSFAGIFGRQTLLGFAPRMAGFETAPIVNAVSLLIVVVGFPVCVLSAVGPFVLRWFAHLDQPRASDPYFLLLAVNLGGMTALVLYPCWIESKTLLAAQWLSWELALAALTVFLLLVAIYAWRAPRNPELEPPPPSNDPDEPLVPRLIGRGPATWPRRWYWLFASALPVGLTMGASDYLTRNVAPTPMLWSLPLVLSLLASSQSFTRISPLEASRSKMKLFLSILYGFALLLAAGLMLLLFLGASQSNSDSWMAVFFCVDFFVVILLMPFAWIAVAQPLSVLLVVFVHANLFKYSQANPDMNFLFPIMVLLHLSCFYLSVRLCLGLLAKDRPAAPALSAYFNWIALGGFCGGFFQLVVVPWLFPGDYLEFAFLAALACTLIPPWLPHGVTDWLICSQYFGKHKIPSGPTSSWHYRVALGFDFGIALGLVFLAILAFLMRGSVITPLSRPDNSWGVQSFITLTGDYPLLIVMLLATFLFPRPLRFGLALALIASLSWVGQSDQRNEKILVERRTPFGITRVIEDTILRHQLHRERQLKQSVFSRGSCIIEPPDLVRYPTAAYHRKGPLGHVLQHLAWFSPPKRRLQDVLDAAFFRQQDSGDARIVASLLGMSANPCTPLAEVGVLWSEPPLALIGLGTGAFLAYAHPGQWVDVYEPDPAIAAFSEQKPPMFHYYQAAKDRGVLANLISGDVRRNLNSLRREEYYQAIVVDAGNANALPTHLLTKEAIALYFGKLAPDGVICIHSTNRTLDLPRVLDKIARKLDCKIVTLRSKSQPPIDEPSFARSEWVILARSQDVLRQWLAPEIMEGQDELIQFRPADDWLERSSDLLWTDEHASILPAMRTGQSLPAFVGWMLGIAFFIGIALGLIEILRDVLPFTMLQHKQSSPSRDR